jgi:hypothetical protein
MNAYMYVMHVMCMYVCMYVCMHACMHARECVDVHVCMHAYVSTQACIIRMDRGWGVGLMTAI